MKNLEHFVVKHYNEDPHPSIKGNGFDGLVIGNYREEAEGFIALVNTLIDAQNIKEAGQPAHNSAMDAMRRLVGLWSQEGDLVDAVNETKRIVSEWNAAQHQ